MSTEMIFGCVIAAIQFILIAVYIRLKYLENKAIKRLLDYMMPEETIKCKKPELYTDPIEEDKKEEVKPKAKKKTK